MDTGESKRALIVGIFIALGIVIFVLGIFTLRQQPKKLWRRHTN
jgi:phospholipid/cholesterol/gamma-HCH transport system substrate-binding protein